MTPARAGNYRAGVIRSFQSQRLRPFAEAGAARKLGLLMGAALAGLGGPAAAQEGDGIAVTVIRAQAFLERSGRWSEDLAATKKPLKNLPRPSNEFGEPGDALLVTLVFKGPKNSESSRQLARDMAMVTVKQVKDATRTLLYRAFGGFAFGETGEASKAFMLDEATCAPLEIEVKVGRSRKLQKFDFACEEVKPEPAAAAKDKPKARGR